MCQLCEFNVNAHLRIYIISPTMPGFCGRGLSRLLCVCTYTSYAYAYTRIRIYIYKFYVQHQLFFNDTNLSISDDYTNSNKLV